MGCLGIGFQVFGYRFVKNIERSHRHCILYAHPAHKCCYRLLVLAFLVSVCCLVRVLGIGSGCTRPSEAGPSPARGQKSSNRTSWDHFRVSAPVCTKTVHMGIGPKWTLQNKCGMQIIIYIHRSWGIGLGVNGYRFRSKLLSVYIICTAENTKYKKRYL